MTVHEEEKSEEEMKQSQTARAKVSEYLEKNGVRVQRVRRQIDLRKLTVEKISRVFKILDDIGIDHNQRHRIISNRPTILTTKDDLLRHRVKIMRIVGIFPESVAYVVKESPGVLTARIEESLPDKVGLTKRLIRTHSNFLKCNWFISCIIFHQSFYTVVIGLCDRTQSPLILKIKLWNFQNLGIFLLWLCTREISPKCICCFQKWLWFCSLVMVMINWQ